MKILSVYSSVTRVKTYPPRAKASRRSVTETMSPTIYSRNGTRIQVS